jgi:hypothetical protein
VIVAILLRQFCNGGQVKGYPHAAAAEEVVILEVEKEELDKELADDVVMEVPKEEVGVDPATSTKTPPTPILDEGRTVNVGLAHDVEVLPLAQAYTVTVTSASWATPTATSCNATSALNTVLVIRFMVHVAQLSVRTMYFL